MEKSNLIEKNKINGRLLKLQTDRDGYKVVGLWFNKKNFYKTVSRLVAEYFKDDWDPELEVDHIDEDKSNNREDNLRMCTNEENREFYHKNHVHEYSSIYKGVCWSKSKKNGWLIKKENTLVIF